MSTKEKFMEKAMDKFGYKFGYDLDGYKNLSSRIFVICSFHGSVQMTASSHLRSFTGCSKCSRNMAKYKKKTTGMNKEEFVKKLKEIYGKIYKYNSVNYKDGASFVTIECRRHGNVRLGIKRLLAGRGCKKCNISKGELRLLKWLIDNKVKFNHQHIFSDCKNIKPLPFDFFLPDFNTAIEFDGEQHYRAVRKFGGKSGFEKLQLHDNIKTSYCSNNNINLLRIKYSDIDLITNIMDLHFKIKQHQIF